MDNSDFTFTGITIDTNDGSSDGFEINTGSDNFHFTDIVVNTDDSGADGGSDDSCGSVSSGLGGPSGDELES